MCCRANDHSELRGQADDVDQAERVVAVGRQASSLEGEVEQAAADFKDVLDSRVAQWPPPGDGAEAGGHHLQPTQVVHELLCVDRVEARSPFWVGLPPTNTTRYRVAVR